MGPAAQHLGDRQPLAVALEELDALGDRLQHAELDAVVDELDEMAGACAAGVHVAALGRERDEDRLDSRHGVLLAARRHEAGAFAGTREAAARAEVDEMQAARLQPLVPPHRVAPVGVAAIDNDVAVVEMRRELFQHRVHDSAGR